MKKSFQLQNIERSITACKSFLEAVASGSIQTSDASVAQTALAFKSLIELYDTRKNLPTVPEMKRLSNMVASLETQIKALAGEFQKHRQAHRPTLPGFMSVGA